MGKNEEKKVISEEEMREREYLLDFSQPVDIPEYISEQFEEISRAYVEYTNKANLGSDKIKADEELIRKEFIFAYKAHRLQKRKTGEPYIIHPLAVAKILTELKVDVCTIGAALLHDTIEDTIVDYDMVADYFGVTVANLVDGVTKLNIKLDNVIYSTKTDIQASNVRKMLLAMTSDIRVIFIKLADRLHNMRTLKYQPPEKQVEKAQETLDIYVPFAGRFGIYRIKWELEDLCLMYLHPDDYYSLIDAVNGKSTDRGQRESFMEQVISEIRVKLEDVGITHFDIEGRPKHIYSIYKKMHDKGKTLDEIYDLYACRIIVDEVIECYTVLGVIHEMYSYVPGRFKDYIAMPKDNGYQSIHTTVVSHTGPSFEVQIRTYGMHQIAEFGIAAHWHYKESGSEVQFKADKYDQKIDEVRQIIESQSELSDSQKFMDSLKMNIAPDEIFTYTPKRAVIKLPQGSCPIDFAYAIHSGVGHHMHGAKVNGRIVPLSYQLKSGDTVEILSSMKLVKGPSRDWVNIARTSTARSRINGWFKREARADNIVAGKRELNREIERNGFDSSKLLTQQSVNAILKRNHFEHIDDMYAAIGYGSISTVKVFGKLRDDYIRRCSEAERNALGYRVTADGNVAYSPKDLPIQIGKFDQSHSKGGKVLQNRGADGKQMQSYDASAINALGIDPHQAVNGPRGSVDDVVKNAKTLKSDTANKRRAHRNDDIIVDGIEVGAATHLSRCCHPIYGDDIVGYVTQENGVGIHKKTCNNIVSIVNNKDKDAKSTEKYNHLVSVRWLDNAKGSSYDIRLVVVALNREKILLDVLDKVYKEKVENVMVNTVVDGNVVKIFITLNVSGKEQLDRVILHIMSLPDVSDIIRN